MNPFHSSDTVRRDEATGYFGETAMSYYSDPESFWCPQARPGKTGSAGNAKKFLFHRIWDRPTRGETHIGVRIGYSQVSSTDIVETLLEAETRGDFCTIHVDRNPVVSYVSSEQARQSGYVARQSGSAAKHTHTRPVLVEIDPLVEYIHNYEQVKHRLRRDCRDVLWVPYESLVDHPRRVMRMVSDYLELPQKRMAADFVRLKHKDLPRRITNWNEVKSTRNRDVLRYLQQPWT